MRSASAMPRSSPKFGSVTMMPSIWSRFAWNRSAHFRDFRAGLHGAVLALFGRRGRPTSWPALLQRRDHLLASALRQVVGKESPVSYNQSKCHVW